MGNSIEQMIATAVLTRQSYGIATAGNTFGGPRGIWLECSTCQVSHVIIGSASDEWAAVTDAQAAQVFRRHEWYGEGDRMLKAMCPSCTGRAKRIAETIAQECERQAQADGPSPWANPDNLAAAKLDGDFDLYAIARALIVAGVEPKPK